MAVTRADLDNRLNAFRNATPASPISKTAFADFLNDWINYMTNDGEFSAGALRAWRDQILNASAQVSHAPSGQITAVTVKAAIEQLDALNLTLKNGFVRALQKASTILDFANTRALNPQFTFTRNSVGTYIDRNGQVKVAKVNEARFQHDPKTMESLGLLIEVSRTNLITYSSDLSGWVRGAGCNYVGSSTILGYPAYTFQNVATANAFVGQSINLTANTTYVFTYYSTSSLVGYFRLSRADNSITRTPSNFTSTLISAGLYKHEITFTTAADEVKGTAHVGPIDTLATFTVSMPQLEVGSFGTSFIPTSATTVTRDADVFMIPSNVFTRNFGTITEGAFTVQYTVIGNSENTVCELRGVDTTGWNVVRAVATNSYARHDVIKDGSTTSSLVNSASVLPANNKIAVNFGTNFSQLYLNGVGAGEDLTVDVPTNIDRVKIFGSGVLLVKNITVFKRNLGASEGLLLSNPAYTRFVTREDFGSAAYLDRSAILADKSRQEFTVDGTGASISRNIRRPYDFKFEVVDSSGCTGITVPSTDCVADTDNTLTFTAPVGKCFTYAITPVSIN